MHCPVIIPVSQCAAQLFFQCHNALLAQSSTVTMLCRGQSSTDTIHCQLSLPLSRCIAAVSLPLSRFTAIPVFHCHDALLGQSSTATMHCLSVLHCHDALL
ncbi:hypothetical protein PoB_004458600 [Plakobranchus ocellatus]|uniref:Uncharacterized protein n=1 Tax=Plakobranchus ocellatus TaxID=259542 RepID=A0AAV4BCD0_9GAST|nr:hypothetical protein PoB_004458600 [Plakobranchus ocellatus]